MVLFYNGVAKRIGGSNLETAKRNALQHMRRVMKVCEDAVRSEFPSFDSIMAFNVFNLKSDVGGTTSGECRDMIESQARQPQQQQNSLERLALVFRVPAGALVSENQYLHRVASSRMKTAGTSNREAWQFAWRRCSASRNLQDLRPVPGLHITGL